MDPITASLFVGASFFTSVASNKNQARLEAASIKMQTEQARLQAAEAALERTKTFRQNIASNLALSGMGYGSTTALAVSNAQGASNYGADINALQLQESFAMASGQAGLAGVKAKKFASNVGAVDSAVSLASKLGLFSGKGGK